MSSHAPIDVSGAAATPLRIVHVDGRSCVLSTGEELLVKHERLRDLCLQLMQEGADVTVRTWITSDGSEMIECHRVGASRTDDSPKPQEAF